MAVVVRPTSIGAAVEVGGVGAVCPEPRAKGRGCPVPVPSQPHAVPKLTSQRQQSREQIGGARGGAGGLRVGQQMTERENPV